MISPRWEHLLAAVVDARAVHRTQSWAQAVCFVCVAEIPSVDAAAVTLRTHSRAQELHGASDTWAVNLEQAQYTLGEGPGVDSFATGGPVLVDDLADDQTRWPAFADAAQDAGAAAAFAFPLLIGAIRIGTLDLYRHRPGELSSEEVAEASSLADLAASILGQQFRAAERTGSDAPRPLTSYQDVNIATGMMAARLQVSMEDAFARLRAWAFSENRSLLDVAQDVVHRRITLDQLAE